MPDEMGFTRELGQSDILKEIDIVERVAWFLGEVSQSHKTRLGEICDFIESRGIRLSLNRSRIRTNILGRPGITCSKAGEVSVSLAKRTVFEGSYRHFLDEPRVEPKDTVLEASDFDSSRPYVRSLVRQINASRQFQIYDGCAVLMRRLMEVLIIDAYEGAGKRNQIVSDGDYLQLSGLIGALASGRDFKLSRNAKKWMEACKTIGDNAAHSRTYITKRLDVDEFCPNYRNLISELSHL